MMEMNVFRTVNYVAQKLGLVKAFKSITLSCLQKGCMCHRDGLDFLSFEHECFSSISLSLVFKQTSFCLSYIVLFFFFSLKVYYIVRSINAEIRDQCC